MANHSPVRAKSTSTPPRSVLIVYETASAREHMLRKAPDLGVTAGEDECSKAAGWLSFEQVTTSSGAVLEATLKAASADLIVFALEPSGELPLGVKLWIETWISKRGEREGTIVAIPAGKASPADLPGLKEIYLRHVAHNSGMDYMDRVPSSQHRAMPDSLDSFCHRAGQVTSVLDEILTSKFPPIHPR